MDRFYAKFINLNFHLALLPFRVELIKTKNNYGELVQHYKLVDGHPLQRLIAGTILVLDVFQGVFLTRGAYWGMVVEQPSVLFLIWKTLHNSLILAILWGWTFWRRGKHYALQRILGYLLRNRRAAVHNEKFHDSFSDDEETRENLVHSALMWTFLVSIGVIFPIGGELLQIFNVDGIKRHPTLGGNFRLSSAQVLFDICLVKNHTYISPKDFTMPYFTVSVVYMVLRTWGKVVLGMAHILTFLAAVTFLLEVKRLYRGAFSIQYNLKNLIQSYLHLRRLIHLLNSINRPILLCLVSASVPLMVLRVIHAWDSSQLSIQFIILIKLIQFLTIVIVSAEANQKALRLKTRLLEICNQDNEGADAWSGHIFRADLGLDAGRFVKISFSFIGSMFSAYLSYAIMLLQITPCKSFK